MDFGRKAKMYSSQRATLKKKKMMMIMNGKKERPKGDGYIVSPYLRQKVENF